LSQKTSVLEQLTMKIS